MQGLFSYITSMKLSIHALELDKEVLPMYLQGQLYDFRIDFETKQLTATLEGSGKKINVMDLTDIIAVDTQPTIELNTAEIILKY